MVEKNILNMIICQLVNSKSWVKKKMVALSVVVVMALITNQFQSNKSTGITTVSKKGDIYTAKVIKVADGDTITVIDMHGSQHKIRFAYIDAPEKVQIHGIASKDALTKLIDGKNVEIYVIDVDRYQREVSVVKVNGMDVNYEQVKNGNAWHYQIYARKFQSNAEYNQYAAALAAAEKNRIGLWSGKKPQEPWVYRAQVRAEQN